MKAAALNEMTFTELLEVAAARNIEFTAAPSRAELHEALVDAAPTLAERDCACAECGETFAAKRDHANFCSTKCRKTWNNRRATRGAELYDLFMALRYDRKWSSTVGMWQLICRLASEWKRMDNEAGRTYVRPEKWLEANRAWLKSINLGVVKIGRGNKA